MSEMKVTDRRWWVKNESADGESAAEEPKLKPRYIEELEAQIAAKNEQIQELLTKYRSASSEFDDARARLRKEVTKDVERGRRSMLISFLEVLDNLDRALGAAEGKSGDPVVEGVALVRQQFIATLEGLGVKRVDPLGQPFDPSIHEAITSMPAPAGTAPNTVVGVIKPGYLINDEVLRPAGVVVST
jgi:molecular chaperone GrpE